MSVKVNYWMFIFVGMTD